MRPREINKTAFLNINQEGLVVVVIFKQYWSPLEEELSI